MKIYTVYSTFTAAEASDTVTKHGVFEDKELALGCAEQVRTQYESIGVDVFIDWNEHDASDAAAYDGDDDDDAYYIPEQEDVDGVPF